MKLKLLRSLLTSFVVILFLSGCAHKKYKFEYEHQGNEKTDQLIWPLAPETARYRYLGEIVGETNFKEIKNSEGSLRKGFSWLGRFIFGEGIPLTLHRPHGGYYDKKHQRIFVTDVGQKKVFVFDLLNGRVEAWEGGGFEQSFITPISITILQNDQVLITDADLGFVLRFDATGKYLGAFGEVPGTDEANEVGKADEKNAEIAEIKDTKEVGKEKNNVANKKKLLRPTGITHDPLSKKVFIADSQSHEIHVFSESGKWLSAFGGKGAADGKFNAPTHLAFANNVLHVSDTLNARVQLFDANGKWLRSFGKRGLKVGNMPRPKGIAVDSDANVYVVESYYDHLLMFNESGQSLMALGGSGNKPGQFDLPAGVWIDDKNRIYIADMFNQRVSVFQYLSVADQ
ncbi:MAG: 6-bladed beta-propeller [Gammaproteobacteria bacterium]|nr:6-bladed beta-propeller [Gammaproteobacteria bacterium]